MELEVTISGDESRLSDILRRFPSAVLKGGVVVVRIQGSPAEVGEEARALLEVARTPGGSAKARRRDKRL